MRYRFIILSYNTGKDGKTAVTLRVTKNRKRKYINTGLRAVLNKAIQDKEARKAPTPSAKAASTSQPFPKSLPNGTIRRRA